LVVAAIIPAVISERTNGAIIPGSVISPLHPATIPLFSATCSLSTITYSLFSVASTGPSVIRLWCYRRPVTIIKIAAAIIAGIIIALIIIATETTAIISEIPVPFPITSYLIPVTSNLITTTSSKPFMFTK